MPSTSKMQQPFLCGILVRVLFCVSAAQVAGNEAMLLALCFWQWALQDWYMHAGAGAAQGQQGQQAAAPAAAAGPNTQPLDMFNPQVAQAPHSAKGMPALVNCVTTCNPVCCLCIYVYRGFELPFLQPLLTPVSKAIKSVRWGSHPESEICLVIPMMFGDAQDVHVGSRRRIWSRSRRWCCRRRWWWSWRW